MENTTFIFREDAEGYLLSLKHRDDVYKMNWVEGKNKWGTVRAPQGIETRCIRRLTSEDTLEECYCFQNTGEFPVFFGKTDLAIYTPFNDDYENAEHCLHEKCHTHLFCNGRSAYVMAVRMGGEGPHLGLRLTAGSLQGYSVERRADPAVEGGVVSNDRGDFLLHPDILCLQPGEETQIRWELFWFDTSAEFKEKLLVGGKNLWIETRQCTYFPGETLRWEIHGRGNPDSSKISIQCGGQAVPFEVTGQDGRFQIACTFRPSGLGEYKMEAQVGEAAAEALFYVSANLRTLAEKRCRFLAEKQQYHRAGDPLDGAYLIYDNEEDRLFYDHAWHDHNAGRERIGMGALMALWLTKQDDVRLRKSLQQYVQFVYRELYDSESGTVFNDIQRNQEWHRLYNYPWVSILQLELYHLTSEKSYLQDACRTLRQYYRSGGERFYAIGIPMDALLQGLEQNGMLQEAEELNGMFLRQADIILENSLHYPPFEVNYEQSIVAPAVDLLLQAFSITKLEKYLEEARKQMAVLELFQARQPEYHQFENAIRHWDGYWFGKNQMLGDTYPHYWSVLSGVAFARYAEATGESAYLEKAHASLRGCLNLFTAQGQASCAMVFPETVNGRKAHTYDPWANDQDWALYFALKYEEVVSEFL